MGGGGSPKIAINLPGLMRNYPVKERRTISVQRLARSLGTNRQTASEIEILLLYYKDRLILDRQV